MNNYIQIGTNTGNDDFYKFICDLHEPINLYLIEANSEIIDVLHENYKNYIESNSKSKIFFINLAIIDNDKENKINLYLGNSNQHSSVINRTTLVLPRTIEVNAMSFNKFVEIFNIKNIEFLCIDVEGYDYSILNSINFDNIKINKIQCELWPYDEDSTKDIQTGPTFLQNILLPKMNKYYNMQNESNVNLIFTRKENTL
jgi:hypothetical protein